ncbi:ferrochelatase [Niabella ginsenosidivorans]|uniref:Ferrochelatase n=1 Tax=Niabella ginsenosidivorans TaxID=1176587 RepID=A0A1A9I8U4_9BACT|nr:ferrochelatase [Niabella ginsenosidivorans]ANH83489.1 ferrochelatase [Niabella ginsenosidivorans]
MRKTGVILMNLGSPDSTEVRDVRKYLNEFLMDKRVIDKPFWLRFLLVKGIITPFRAPKSAEAYSTIWWKEGSPLIVLSERLREAIQKKTDLPVELSMRYGNPTPEASYNALLKRMPDVEEVILVPLYPHYAMSSFETAVEHMKKAHKKNNYSFALKVVPPYYKHPAYINALSESMRPYLQEDFDQLLFSYHGIPVSHIYKTDTTNSFHNLNSPEECCTHEAAQATCYRYQVMTTSRLVAKALGLSKKQWQISYQSRLGRDPWLLPNTQVRLPELPGEHIKKLVVACPSFVSDCLETLEEIEMRGKEDFLKHGGEKYTYIPCMNTCEPWIDALLQLIEETATSAG